MTHHHHHYQSHHHSYHHSRPLGMVKNYYHRFDNAVRREERLHPHMMKPLQGLKHVANEFHLMDSIAPDLNNQKIVHKDGSVLSSQHAVTTERTSHMHLMNKFAESNRWYAVGLLGAVAFVVYTRGGFR
jgi:hypothetical protein